MAPRKKTSNPTPTEEILNDDYAPGKPSEILLNYAEGHYQKVFTDEGQMAFLDKHTQRTLKIPEDSLHLMEILHGYEIMLDRG